MRTVSEESLRNSTSHITGISAKAGRWTQFPESVGSRVSRRRKEARHEIGRVQESGLDGFR